jgi:hypothetical protein
MNRIYVKFDGTNAIRFNWPDDPVGDWSVYNTKHPVRTPHEAIQLLEWILDYNGYTDILYSFNWEFIAIEEDHDN